MGYLTNKSIHCPNCNKELDGYVCMNEDGEDILPEKGDVSVCVYCVSLLEFNVSDDNRLVLDRLILSSRNLTEQIPLLELIKDVCSWRQKFVANVIKKRA